MMGNTWLIPNPQWIGRRNPVVSEVMIPSVTALALGTCCTSTAHPGKNASSLALPPGATGLA